MNAKYEEMSNDEFVSYIRQKLSEDYRWVRRALITLYNEQTEEEKMYPHLVHQSDGKGFSPADQEFLSSLARQAEKGLGLTYRQNVWASELLPKYARQLARLARTKDTSVEPGLAVAPAAKSEEEEQTGTTFYFRSFLINTPRKTLEAISGDLGLAEPLPSIIIVRSPSGDTSCTFREKSHASDEFGDPSAVFYTCMVDGEEWEMTIEIKESQPLAEREEELWAYLLAQTPQV